MLLTQRNNQEACPIESYCYSLTHELTISTTIYISICISLIYIYTYTHGTAHEEYGCMDLHLMVQTTSVKRQHKTLGVSTLSLKCMDHSLSLRCTDVFGGRIFPVEKTQKYNTHEHNMCQFHRFKN